MGESARAVAAFVAANDLHDVLIVAHSKGGLIGKYVMAVLDEQRRISGMVAVSTPFGGSRYAPFLVLPRLRAFSPEDPTLQQLVAAREVNARSAFGMSGSRSPMTTSVGMCSSSSRSSVGYRVSALNMRNVLGTPKRR